MIVQTLVVLCATILIVSAAKCPKPEEIAPCLCYEGSSPSLHCVGTNVTDQTMKLLTTTFSEAIFTDVKAFHTLEIFGTAIKSIPENALSLAKFTDIYVKNNNDLEKINPNAFKASEKYATILEIQNNPKLTGNEVYDLVRNLDLLTRVRLDSNSLTEIPAHAFTPKTENKGHIETLYLTENKIKSIGNHAFYGQPVIRVVSIKNNLIERLDDNALTVSKSEGSIKTTSIYLNHNLLNEKSFTNLSLSNPEHDDISIHIENNHLTSLPKDIFGSFMMSSNLSRLYLLNNKFICDCSMKWVNQLAKTTEMRFNEIFCSDHSKQDINLLTPTDFGHCTYYEY